MYDIILDTLMDGIRLLPFLFVTYIVMEYIEHKMSAGTRRVVQASGRFGPLIGSIAGIFPQCGFLRRRPVCMRAGLLPAVR